MTEVSIEAKEAKQVRPSARPQGPSDVVGLDFPGWCMAKMLLWLTVSGLVKLPLSCFAWAKMIRCIDLEKPESLKTDTTLSSTVRTMRVTSVSGRQLSCCGRVAPTWATDGISSSSTAIIVFIVFAFRFKVLLQPEFNSLCLCHQSRTRDIRLSWVEALVDSKVGN